MKLLAESEPVMAAAPVGSDTAGVPWLPPFGPASMMLAGFRDCAEEVLRFLAEVEGVPQSDPLYTGLHRFLLEKERCLPLPQCPVPSLQVPDPLLPQPYLSPLPGAVLFPGMDFGVESEQREATSEGGDPFAPQLPALPEACPVQTVVEECGASLLPPASQCEGSTVQNLVNELLVLLQEEAMAAEDMDDDCVDEEDNSCDVSNSSEETVDQ